MGPYWITELACIYVSTQAHGKFSSVSRSITDLFLQCSICTAFSFLHRADAIKKHFANEFPAHPKQRLCVALHGRCHSWAPAATSSWITASLGWGGKGRVLQAFSRTVPLSAISHALLSTFADSVVEIFCWMTAHSSSSSLSALLNREQELTEATKDFLQEISS